MKYYLSADTGNSSFKAIIVDTMEQTKKLVVKQPSASHFLLKNPIFSEENPKIAVTNLLDEMIVHASSDGLKRIGKFAVGSKAYRASEDGTPRLMNIKIGNKHKEDLFMLMPLSSIAAKAVQDSFDATGEIPNELNVNVSFTTALPAREFTPEIAEEISQRFVNGTHTIDMYAMKKPTIVRITFERAKVYKEGIPAIHAIVNGGKLVFKEYDEKYPNKPLKNVDLLKKKVLLVDVGDGTTEFIYIVNGAVHELSRGERRGVGQAVTSAIELLREELGIDLKMNRQQFMDAVQDQTHHYHSEAKQCFEAARIDEIERIAESISEMFLNKLAGNVDLIIVAGGGSIAFKNELSELLYDFAEETNSQVLWTPKRMAVSLNAIGLDILNRQQDKTQGTANEGAEVNA